MPQSLLEIHIHLADGSLSKFAQYDPESVRTILSHIQHEKIFSQPSLVIASTGSVTAIPPALITRLDLVMEEKNIPDWLLQLDSPVLEKWEVTLEQFRHFARPGAINLLQEAARDVNQKIFFEDIRLMGGARCLMEVQLSAELEVEDPTAFGWRRHLHSAFSLPHLSCRRLGGGVCILNPAQIVSYTFHPGLEPPANAWPAQPVLT